MRYLMTVTYDGQNFNGFQKQTNKNTIQDHLESALKTILKQDISCVGSGRTDEKVSAYIQPVHFDYNKAIDTKKTLHSLNGILPSDIRVLSIVETDIHARFSAKKKTYLYRMYTSNIDLPLQKHAFKISPNIDFRAMKKFLHLIKGTHDFIGFRASGSETESSVRTIYKAKLIRRGINVDFVVTGNGFLYKMVRNIVGTMLKIGGHKIDLSTIKSTLFTTYKCTATAKPDYLYLLNVKYK